MSHLLPLDVIITCCSIFTCELQSLMKNMDCDKKLRTAGFRLEWQVFRNTENTEKSLKLGTKWKIAENTVYATLNKKYARKSMFFKYFKIKFIFKSFKLV